MTSSKPHLLILITLPEAHLAQLAAQFEVHYAPTRALRERALAEHAASFRLILTNGATGVEASELQAMPAVTLLAALGAGYENLPLEQARRQGVAVVNGSGTNADCVADQAFALLLACVRDVVQFDAACRQGVWRDKLPMRPNASGKNIGIVGLGTIGEKIAKRAAGFDMNIGYHNRRARAGSGYRYFDSLAGLAQWCDYLVIATPGGADTRHMVNREILSALGPHGFLVNIARGSVVDTEALAQALREHLIAGAGLDVYEGEPNPPQALIDLPNVVLSPHVGGASPEAIDASVNMFIDNAQRHLAGEAVLTPL